MRGAEQPGETPPAGESVLLRHVRTRAADRAAARAASGVADPATAPPAAPPVPPARTPERAVAAALGRAADRLHGLPLFFDRVVTGHAVLAELPELLPDPALISVVEGPGDTLGVVAVCPGLLASLIEMQAMGRISARPAPVRRPTRTDGAISADFVNACLAELAAELAHQPGFGGMGGFRYASFLDDPRPLELLLEDVAYRHVSVTLRAGPAGQRDGRMVVLLPAPPAVAGPAPHLAPEPPHEGVAPDPGAGKGALADAVRDTPIEMVGILCRRHMSLGELRGLSAGDLIALPPGALSAATLETGLGQPLFRGKLGELAGRHALRVTGPRGTPDDRAGGRPFHETGAAAGDGAGTGGSDGRGTAEPPMVDLSAPDPFREDTALGESGLRPAEVAAVPADLSVWEDMGEALPDLPQLGIG